MLNSFYQLLTRTIKVFTWTFDQKISNEDWGKMIKDARPDFDVVVKSEKMKKGYTVEDVINNNIIVIKNQDELQNKLFYYDENNNTFNVVNDRKIKYLAGKHITKDFDKYLVLSKYGLYDNLGSFDFEKILESDNGINYIAEESFVDHDKNLYVLKCTEVGYEKYKKVSI